jgi:hypothetical protein
VISGKQCIDCAGKTGDVSTWLIMGALMLGIIACVVFGVLPCLGYDLFGSKDGQGDESESERNGPRLSAGVTIELVPTTNLDDAGRRRECAPPESDQANSVPFDGWNAVTATMFTRYDLDDSGTLNSNNELEQMTMNLVFKMPPGIRPLLTSLKEAINQVAPLSDDNAWNLDDFRAWFIKEILKAAAFSALDGHVPLDYHLITTRLLLDYY